MHDIRRFLLNSLGGVLLFLPALLGLSWIKRTNNDGAVPLLPPLYANPAEITTHNVLKPGESLSELLENAGVHKERGQLIDLIGKNINLRRLPIGAELTVRRLTQDNTVRELQLQFNADSVFQIERESSGWATNMIVVPVRLDTAYLSGTIQDGESLYQAIVGSEDTSLPRAERIRLVAALADIYQYRINFAHETRPGDQFRFVFERQVRPDGSARDEKIIAAEIKTRRENLSAFYFGESGTAGYYDEKGNPLRMAFSRYPIDYVRITSAFNPNRYHPVLRKRRPHNGTDFGAAPGTPVKAVARGTVVSASYGSGYGNMVELRHWDGYTTRYAHLRGFAKGIRPGTKVEQGTVIGYVGSTGLATGPHLHYEIRKNGKPLDPASVRLPGAPPLSGKQATRFLSMAKDRAKLLPDFNR